MNAIAFPMSGVVASLLCLAGSATVTAGDKRGPHLDSVSLRDFDQSHEIVPSPKALKPQLLKPRNVPGYDALQSAYWSSGPNIPAALLANGADPNAKSKEGEPILHYAVWRGDLDRLEDLLKAGADPNLADRHGQTALEGAIWRGNVGVVRLLLRYGADPNRKGSHRMTALEDAIRQERKEIAALLQAKPAATVVAPGITSPQVLRRPDRVFGSTRFRAAGGGQALLYSADNRHLIAGDERGGLRFLDPRTGELRHVFTAHDHAVVGLARIPRSPYLISTGDDRTTRFWNADTSQEVMRLRWGSYGLGVSPDGRLLFNGYHLWHIESAAELKLGSRGLEIKDPDSNVGTRWAFFTPDSRYLVIGREHSGIWLWDVRRESLHKLKNLDMATTRAITWKDLAEVCEIGTATPTDLLALLADQYTVLTAPAAVLKAFAAAVPTDGYSRALACSPDGQYLATLGYDSRIDVYDLENEFRKLDHDGHKAAVLAVCASPDGKWIASTGNDQTARIWDRATGKQLEEIPIASYGYSIRFSPDNRHLVVGDNDSRLHVWDVQERKLDSLPVSGRLTDLAFTPAGDVLVLGWNLHLVDVKTRTSKADISAASANQGTIALSPQGLIAGTANSMAASETYKVPEAWLLSDNKLSLKKDLFSEAMGHRSFVEAVAFSPDGELLAASSSAAIRLWDMKKRQPVGTKMCGHTSSLSNLRFSPDGKWLASGAWDGTARVWDVATGRQLLLLDADVDRVSGVDFAPDGQLLTANWDGTVHQWDVPKHLGVAGKK